MKTIIIMLGTYTYLHNIMQIILNIVPYPVRHLYYKLRLKKMGKQVYIDYECDFRYHNKVVIGDNVIINRGCKFFGSFYDKSVMIRIGNNVRIAPYVTIFTAGHDYNYLELPDIAESVTVGSNVWIGGQSTLLPGVTIGDGSIIGARSVVTKNIPPYSIAVGNPAKVIRKRNLKV